MPPAHRNEPHHAPGPDAGDGSTSGPEHGTDSPTQHATHHARVRRAWRLGTPLVVLLSGALFAVSAINSQGTDLRPGRYTDLASLTEAESRTYAQLQDEATGLKTEVDQLTRDVVDERVRRVERKAARLRGGAGLEQVSGTGVTVVLSDADEDRLLEAIDQAGGDTSLVDSTPYNVHQQDIQAVVNALWAGGATAVTVQGQRIVTTTGIKCAGSAVLLQGVPYPQPYRIEAVGNTASLVSSLDADSAVAGFRADADDPEVGVGWELDEDVDVTAPAYDGLVDITQARIQR